MPILAMPRTARALGHRVLLSYVLNRGMATRFVFHKDGYLGAFLEDDGRSYLRVPMHIICFTSLMPNHFHMALSGHVTMAISADGCTGSSPPTSGATSATTHSSGHVWRGRFKAFPIQADDHLELSSATSSGNPLRAKLVGASRTLAMVEPLGGFGPAPITRSGASAPRRRLD